MFSYAWPIALVVLSNLFYQICAKSVPYKMNPFASLAITYSVGAVVSVILYFVLNKDANLIKEFSLVNWAPFVLGLTIVGLEVGFIYAYKVGWPISTASIVQSAFLAVALLIVGIIFYREGFAWNRIVGVAVCLVGLFFLNMR